jgi:hypothetical protein
MPLLGNGSVIAFCINGYARNNRGTAGSCVFYPDRSKAIQRGESGKVKLGGGQGMDVISRMKERQVALRQATRHVLTRVAKCIDVDGGIFENALH